MSADSSFICKTCGKRVYIRVSDEDLCQPCERFQNHSFSQEDIWHEMRALGCDERQAIRSLLDAEDRMED